MATAGREQELLGVPEGQDTRIQDTGQVTPAEE